MLKRPRLMRTVATLLVFGIDLAIWSTAPPMIGSFQVPYWLLFSLCVIAYAWLLLGRSPWYGYIAMMLMASVALGVETFEYMGGYLMALFLVARNVPGRRSVYALAGSVYPIGVISFNALTYDGPVSLVTTFIVVGLWTLLSLAAWSAGRALLNNDHQLVTERRWAEEALDEATATERLRISRDLHDSVAHSMTAIVLQVAGVRTVLKSGKDGVDVDKVLEDVQSTAEQSMRELHRLLGMLRSAEHNGSSDRPHSIADVAELVASARASGLEVEEHATGRERPLDPSISHAAYRVVQESLSNAMKHAGTGAKVELGIDWSSSELVLTVRSISGLIKKPGVSGGYGLLGLRERISVSGGTLDHGATSNGYLLKATLPVTGQGELSGSGPPQQTGLNGPGRTPGLQPDGVPGSEEE